jgi:DMSO/TMAO reductase YedYZ molybdopterin-dependent catalytic subunit
MTQLSRRDLLVRASLASVGSLSLANCGVLDQANNAPSFRELLGQAEGLTQFSQRLLQSPTRLAREFRPDQISAVFKANGTTNPSDAAYRAAVDAGFETWRLRVDGLVKRPVELSLGQLAALPQRSQITRHDCVEGWSAIGQWQGPQLSRVLALSGLQPDARYLVFHCADTYKGTTVYYESIDLIDAFHPQTILATGMNGSPLSIAHGAPLRLRVERQLGYKQAKYVMRIEAVSSFASLGKGHGGYWPDRGYEWYAGI